MKKRLLFAFMAMFVAVSGFALSEGEFVYTPQGRFQIIGANMNANSAFADWTGWTVIKSAESTATIADKFNQNVYDGFNSALSVDATAAEGMYYRFEPTDAGASYVVSFKMKGAPLDNIRIKTGDLQENVVKVSGHEIDNIDSIANELIVNTAEELTEDWQTFYYAIQGDGTARTWFISFTGMATTIEIADLQIAPAMQFADLRQRDAMLEKLNTYKNCYAWPEDVLADVGYDEIIAGLNEIGDESGQADLDEQITTAKEILADFLDINMDDFLAGRSDRDNYFDTWRAKWQKVNMIGDWTCLPANRGFWENADQGCVDLGHYAGNTGWNFDSVDGPMGVYQQKNLDEGVYVFSIDGRGAVREKPTSSCWANNDAWNVAYGEAYIVKINEGEGAVPDTIAVVRKDLDAELLTNVMLTAKIETPGTYEIGFKGYCKDAYKALKNGSVLYVANASIWGKTNNPYNQKQLKYEEAVREQITTGRNELTSAADNLANAAKLWGKADLQACVDTIAPKIAVYEAMTQEEIIATYDRDIYVKTTADSTGILVWEVYQTAVKDIIAANKFFTAVNDTLESIQTAIEAATKTMYLRVFDAATGKADLQAAINTAKGVQAQMKAAQYSEENAATIVAAIEALNEAVNTFKTTVPASAIATIVDIDFEQDAVQDADTQLYSVAGAAGSMEFSAWSVDGTGNQPFEKGFWSNGEQLYKGYIRVGNGTGTVSFDPSIDGDMGTNILKMTCDFYLQGLSGRNIGFFLKDVVDENEAYNVAGFYANYYNNTIDAASNLPIELGSLQYGSGGAYNNVSPEDVEEPTATVMPKNSFEVILDYGKGTMYATTTSAKGTVMTEEQDFDLTIPNTFILQCNYNNNDRRCWFDNLKIERITAGEYDPTGIADVKANVKATQGAIYNLAGQKVTKSFKGIVVKDGKKYVVK